MVTPPKPNPFIKPTLDTRFHIDYDWWERSPGEDLRIYLLSHLQPDQRTRLADQANGDGEDHKVDYIDPETAEVFQANALELALRVAAQDASFINAETSLVDSVFRVLLRNGNTPVSSRDLEAQTSRPAQTILKMLSGGQIYKGIRPYTGS
jgi:hypothetical protein